MKRKFVLIPVLALALVASGVLLAQNDPFVGTWKLDLAKSTYVGQQAPKSLTRTVVAQGSGERVTYEGIAADGSPILYSLTSNLDGKDSPISGKQSFGADTIAATRVDANTITLIGKRAGKAILTTKSVVSRDGKVLTQMTKGTNGEGRPISVATVWDKQ